VAILERAENFGRKDVLKSRRRIRFAQDAEGRLIASGWPRKRGRPTSDLQQAWVDRFARDAELSKFADPWTREQAECLAKGTGWYWRDVLTSGMNGKLWFYLGGAGIQSQVGILHRQTPEIQHYGAPHITTPTAAVKNDTPVALTANVEKYLDAATLIWDNNTFWSPTTNPSRLTIRASGLYVVGAYVGFVNTGSGYRRAILRLNRTTTIGVQSTSVNNAVEMFENIFTVWPFEAGDYVEVVGFTASTGVNAILRHFFILAMTPEAVL